MTCLSSGTPAWSGAAEAVGNYDKVLFADVCKAGQHPHAGFVTALQAQRKLPCGGGWQSVAAAPTYNPLGSLATFLCVDDIVTAAAALAKE
eukprot:SAG22_NODE_2638_length_2347_cov_2.305605_3_plen_91_part_00